MKKIYKTNVEKVYIITNLDVSGDIELVEHMY